MFLRNMKFSQDIVGKRKNIMCNTQIWINYKNFSSSLIASFNLSASCFGTAVLYISIHSAILEKNYEKHKSFSGLFKTTCFYSLRK
jgi:hypothetical protein